MTFSSSKNVWLVGGGASRGFGQCSRRWKTNRIAPTGRSAPSTVAPAVTGYR